jgi:hypothetical protein
LARAGRKPLPARWTLHPFKVNAMPALNYEQAFDEVCKVVDQHPEL